MDDLKLISSLSGPGTLWLVGGYLRDLLLGRPVSDADLVVKGDAKKLSAAFGRKRKGSVFALDEARGVYRAVVTRAGTRHTFDFASMQGSTVEKDLARRDFTVNAMALPLEGYLKQGLRAPLLDLAGGMKDLKARKIRALGASALKEDPLRVLRAVRQAAELDFTIDPKTLGMLKTHAKGLLKVSPERVREELMKTLVTPRGAAGFRRLDAAGVLALLLPEAEPMRRSGRGYYGKEGVLGHSLDAMASFEDLMERLPLYFPKYHADLRAHLMEPVSGHPRYALLKLGELLHDVGKPATEGKGRDGRVHFYGHEHAGAEAAGKFGKRWRLSGEESRSLTNLVRGHMRPGGLGNAPTLTDKAIYRFYRDVGGDSVGLLVMALGDHFTYLSEKVKAGLKDPVYQAIRRMLDVFYLKKEKMSPPRLIDGRDVMRALKLKPGPDVGRLLEAVTEGQVAGKVSTKAEALAYLKRVKL